MKQSYSAFIGKTACPPALICLHRGFSAASCEGKRSIALAEDTTIKLINCFEEVDGIFSSEKKVLNDPTKPCNLVSVSTCHVLL